MLVACHANILSFIQRPSFSSEPWYTLLRRGARAARVVEQRAENAVAFVAVKIARPRRDELPEKRVPRARTRCPPFGSLLLRRRALQPLCRGHSDYYSPRVWFREAPVENDRILSEGYPTRFAVPPFALFFALSRPLTECCMSNEIRLTKRHETDPINIAR